MKKTSIYLEPGLDRALASRAASIGISKAELIRRALAAEVAGRKRIKPAARGVFNGPPDLGERVDDHLRDFGFGEK